TLGNTAEFQRTGGIHDNLVVDRSRRNVDGYRAGADDDVVCGDFLHAAIVLGDLNFLAGQQLAGTCDTFHLVGSEQGFHALSQLAHDLGLATNHFRHVDGYGTSGDTVQLEFFLRFHELVGAVQQCLGGNTSYVQAGAAEDRVVLVIVPLLNTGGFQTQLGAADGGYVAGRAGSDYYDVIFVAHRISRFLCR